MPRAAHCLSTLHMNLSFIFSGCNVHCHTEGCGKYFFPFWHMDYCLFVLLYGGCVIVLPGKLHTSKCCVRVESGQNWNTKCVSARGTLPNSLLLFLNYEVRQGRHAWTRVKLWFHSASLLSSWLSAHHWRQTSTEGNSWHNFFFSSLSRGRNICSDHRRYYFILQQFVQWVN